MNKHQERILVIGPAWVGDMVMAQSLFLTLKQTFPDVTIDVLAPAWSLPLLSRMPQVNEAIVLPVSHGQLALAARFRIGRHPYSLQERSGRPGRRQRTGGGGVAGLARNARRIPAVELLEG